MAQRMTDAKVRHAARLMIDHAVRAGVPAHGWFLGKTTSLGVESFAIFDGATDNSFVYILPSSKRETHEMLYAMAYAYDTTTGS